MPHSVNLLVATQDAAATILNATMATQAVKIDDVELYDAVVCNVGLIRSVHYVADFMFPLPGKTVSGVVVNLLLADEDDLKLLNDALDYYFGVRAQPDFRRQTMERKARQKGYCVDLCRDERMYARVRVPCRDCSHTDDVDAYLGYLCRPASSAFEQIKTAYPGLVEISMAKVPVGEAGKMQPRSEDAPGIDVFLEKMESVKNNGSYVEAPLPDELILFRRLLCMYGRPENGISCLDGDMMAAFSRAEDALPFVKKMEYSGVLGRDRKGKFKSCEEIMADVVNSMDTLGAKIVNDQL